MHSDCFELLFHLQFEFAPARHSAHHHLLHAFQPPSPQQPVYSRAAAAQKQFRQNQPSCRLGLALLLPSLFTIKVHEVGSAFISSSVCGKREDGATHPLSSEFLRSSNGPQRRARGNAGQEALGQRHHARERVGARGRI